MILFKKTASFLFFVFMAFQSFSQTTNVLFIGNSYTYYNDMPNKLKAIALSNGSSLYTESHTPGGARISQHATNPAVFTKIRSRNWDYVVIQCQSQEPSWPDGDVNTSVFPYAKTLCDSIRAINECTIPLFYMTWGRENGDAQNCASWPPVCTYLGMDSILRSNYLKMGVNNSAEVSPVGAVWRELRQYAPSLNLYATDGSHPSEIGSMAIAYTFYSAIYRGDPFTASYNGTLGKTIVDSIRTSVYRLLIDKWNDYNIGVNNPKPDIVLTSDTCTVHLKAPDNCDYYYWDFGDGDTSVEQNVSHTYSSSGIFTINLAIRKCKLYGWAKDTFNCARSASITAPEIQKIKLYPNPSKGEISFPEGYEVIKIVNALGQQIEFAKFSENRIKMQLYRSSVVYVTLRGENGVKSVFKVIMK
jgi:hypothetical protein